MNDSLFREFAKITNDSESKSNDVTAYGTIVKNGTSYGVIIDGSTEVAPVEMTMDADDGDRVTLSVKDHKIIVAGNLDKPAQSMKSDAVGEVIDSRVQEKVDASYITNAINSGTTLIDGGLIDTDTLVAKNVFVADEDNNVVFQAIGDEHKVTIGGFTVDSNSLKKTFTYKGMSFSTTIDGRIDVDGTVSQVEIGDNISINEKPNPLIPPSMQHPLSHSWLDSSSLHIDTSDIDDHLLSTSLQMGQAVFKDNTTEQSTTISPYGIDTEEVKINNVSMVISAETITIPATYLSGGVSNSAKSLMFLIPFNRYIDASGVTCKSLTLTLLHADGGYPYARSGSSGGTYTQLTSNLSMWANGKAVRTNEIADIPCTIIPNVGVNVRVNFNYALAKASGNTAAITNNVPLFVIASGTFEFVKRSGHS